MNIIGVDPGNTGGLCHLSDTALQVWDMPVVDGSVNPHGLASIIYDLTMQVSVSVVVVEAVHSMPGQGVASTFKFGTGFGMILGVLAAFELPMLRVSPTKWTRDLGVGSDKEAHRRWVIDTWPAYSDLFARKKDHGRADAALLALWGATCRAPGSSTL